MPLLTAILLPVGLLVASRALAPQMPAPPTVVIATVRIARDVLANGKPLPAGTYELRLTQDRPKVAPRQSPDAARWVEFVSGETRAARAVAEVIPADEIGEVAEGAPPRPGEVRVQMLRTDGILRIWVNHRGTHYLIHLRDQRSVS